MTTLLHISDTHLGKRQYRSEERREDFAAAFDQAIDIALGEHPNHDNEEVDAVIHTGDLFDDSEARLPDMHRCQNILQRLSDANVPFYAIIGNHERKLTTQFIDLYEDAGLSTRLSKQPTVINGEVCLYGIDAIRKRAWESTDFSLEEPEDDDMFDIVCMHQLLTPPIDAEYLAEYEAEEVLDRLNRDIDAMALGDYHKRCSATVNGVDLWYPGSTERCAKDETDQRSVELLDVDTTRDSPLTRRFLTLNTPQFQRIKVEFSEGDTLTNVQEKVEARVPFNGDVVIVELEGENVSVTKQQVYALLDQYDVRVSKVHDNRSLDDFEVDSTPSATRVNDIDSAVSEAFNDRDFSEQTEDITDIIQDTDDTPKSNVEGKVESFLETSGSDDSDDENEEQ